MRFDCSSRFFPWVSNPLTSFKHDDKNRKQGLGDNLQAEVLPLISSLKGLERSRSRWVGGKQRLRGGADGG